MQGTPIEGYGVPLVTDTITDMICNTSGALLFFIHFLVGRKTKCNLGVMQIEKELVYIKNDDSVPHIKNDNEDVLTKRESFKQHDAKAQEKELEERYINDD